MYGFRRFYIFFIAAEIEFAHIFGLYLRVRAIATYSVGEGVSSGEGVVDVEDLIEGERVGAADISGLAMKLGI